jgi:hypothetical protein
MNLKELVENGSNEQAIQSWIKNNLGILGDVCNPSSILGEYIAFSEYPILEGRADFVVFTNRSRMNVVIVEIKGADFNFLNVDGSINANINYATQQLRHRFRGIDRNYEMFRRHFYDVRKRVENGEVLYNSLLGPAKHLEVDPMKEVWLQGLIIGGRSVDDRRESTARHEFECESPHIKIDTWDGWLKKHGTHGDSMKTNYPS